MTSLTLTFPDVCKMPAPPAPFAPVPFPNLSRAPRHDPLGPGPRAGALAERRGRANLDSLHRQIQSLSGASSAQQWQDLLERYVLAATETFRALHPE